MFLHLSVSHSVHKGSAPLHAGIHTPTLGRHPPPRQTQPPPSGATGYGVNKRAVRILLECILVL